MTLWVARAGKYGEREDFALENSVVVVGWDDVSDLSKIENKDELNRILTNKYPDENSRTVGIWRGQLWNFGREFEKGDIVALPLKKRSAIAFGRIIGDYRYVPDAPLGGRHQRPVEWINTDLARSRLDSDLRNSFGAQQTVFKVSRDDAETRIEALLKGTTTSWRRNDEEEGAAALDVDIQRQADDQIIDFISRKFRGHDLTRLVQGVLEAQGCTVRSSPPGADGGVDLVAGQGPMGFGAPRICVQVKSGNDPVDVTVLRELQGVMKNYGADQGLLVSWGGFKNTVLREARQLFFGVRLWDQSDLVRNIQEHYKHFPDDIQAELPMKRTWVLVR